MKRYRLFRALVISVSMILCILCLASPVCAENKAGSASVSIFAGGYAFDNKIDLRASTPNADMDNGFTAGLGLGYNFNAHVGMEGVLNYVWGKLDKKNGLSDKDVRTYLYHLDLLYHFMPDKQLVPYIAAGVGGVSYVPSARGTDTTSDFMANYGLGLKYFIKPAVALRGDVRHVLSFHGGDSTDNNLLYTLGLTFAFGGKEKVEEAAAPPPPQPAPQPQEEMAPPPPPPPPPAPAPKEEPFTFRTVYFDFNKSDLKPESIKVLNEVADFMKSHPDTKMEIRGYCDIKGGHEYNLKLSRRRSAAVVDYLVKHDIAPSRLHSKGFGYTRHIATNKTEAGRAMNRRVDIRPLEIE
jgi:OmpA-OmpF porin, OOP family